MKRSTLLGEIGDSACGECLLDLVMVDGAESIQIGNLRSIQQHSPSRFDAVGQGYVKRTGHVRMSSVGPFKQFSERGNSTAIYEKCDHLLVRAHDAIHHCPARVSISSIVDFAPVLVHRCFQICSVWNRCCHLADLHNVEKGSSIERESSLRLMGSFNFRQVPHASYGHPSCYKGRHSCDQGLVSVKPKLCAGSTVDQSDPWLRAAGVGKPTRHVDCNGQCDRPDQELFARLRHGSKLPCSGSFVEGAPT
jgi:hypothetical protein